MFPTPDDLSEVPAWRTYLYGQLVQASLGNISFRIVFAGLKESGTAVTLVFYVDPPLQDDYREIAEVLENFDDGTGNMLDVSVEVEEWRPGCVDREVSWTYRRWIDEESLATRKSGRLDELRVARP